MNPTEETDTTNWKVEYDVEPIRVRDPVAEALAVLDPGDPFVVGYRDVVKQAGHSCPTAAGAYRTTKLALEALYPDSHPVRGDVEVTMGGPKSDAAYGVSSRIVSYITGAAEEDGFGGLSGGYGGRRNLLEFGDVDADGVAVEFRRTDTDEAVKVVYHVAEVPDAGAAVRYLDSMIQEEATEKERREFSEAWHARVRTVLTDDDLFTVDGPRD